jgi:hypothetical protein
MVPGSPWGCTVIGLTQFGEGSTVPNSCSCVLTVLLRLELHQGRALLLVASTVEVVRHCPAGSLTPEWRQSDNSAPIGSPQPSGIELLPPAPGSVLRGPDAYRRIESGSGSLLLPWHVSSYDGVDLLNLLLPPVLPCRQPYNTTDQRSTTETHRKPIAVALAEMVTQ